MASSPLLRLLAGSLLLAGGLLACTDAGDHGRPGSEEEATPSIVTEAAADAPVFDVRSVTVDARHPPEPDLLVRLRNLGVTHVTLCSFGWQETADDPRVRIDTSAGWYSESHRGIRALARQADTLGMGVILKPHIWVGGYDADMDRTKIGYDSAAEWRVWETSYRRFMMVYARLAREIDADGLVIGTELSRVATERPAFWRGLADTVRTVYDGNLIYAANWYEEYQEITFWDALDYVGVQAYFPLSDRPDPPLDTLKARWREHRRTLADVHERTGKPIVFTEIGYRSAANAAAAPWQWPERDEERVPPDSALQARCYQAFFAIMREAPWFTGAVIWKWHPAYKNSRPTAFTPQNKPAEAVIRQWFRGAPPPPAGS
jgi:hypothetical protein